MRTRILLVCALGCAAAVGQAGLVAPRVGYVWHTDKSLRPVLGTAANFLLGDALVAEAAGAASSGEWTLVKKAEELLLLDAAGQIAKRWTAPAGEARMAFTPAGEAVAAYFVETRQLAWLDADELTLVPVDAEVVAMAAPASGAVALVVRRGEELWRQTVAADGGIVDQRLLPGVAGPVLLRSDGTAIYTSGGELVVRRPDGAEQRVALRGAALGMEELGRGWVALRVQREGAATERRMALRIGTDDIQLYELPGVPK